MAIFTHKTASTTPLCNGATSIRKAASGVVLASIAAFGAVLIGFMGVGIYVGLNAYIQSELHNATSAAVIAGASALYDEVGAGGAPVYNTGRGVIATQQVFNKIISRNPALQAFGAGISEGPTVNDDRTILLGATAQIPMPFLAPIGLGTIGIRARSMAQYARQSLPAGRFTMSSLSAPFTRAVNLDPPLLDGPGTDLYIIPDALNHGYMVEVCSAGQCVDVSKAARGTVVDRMYFGRRRQVIYGPAYIDLGAINGFEGYNKLAQKGAQLKILDDGIPDRQGGGGRALELFVRPTVFTGVFVYHHATLCDVRSRLCNVTGGFEPTAP